MENDAINTVKDESPLKTSPKKAGFMSMKGINTAHGISMQELKAAKRLGCGAFKANNNVAVSELLPWMEANKGLIADYLENSMDEIKRQNLLKDGLIKDLQIKKQNNELVSRIEVQDAWHKVGIALCSMLNDKLKKEYIPKMEGKTLVDMLVVTDLFIAEFVNKVNSGMDEWKQ